MLSRLSPKKKIFAKNDSDIRSDTDATGIAKTFQLKTACRPKRECARHLPFSTTWARDPEGTSFISFDMRSSKVTLLCVQNSFASMATQALYITSLLQAFIFFFFFFPLSIKAGRLSPLLTCSCSPC
ncbi:MAG TPA: hypothetical protein VGO47_09180 [Chlamydiales bacterium]|nr:hypothetical protein [Chlamydiales bacterium]